MDLSEVQPITLVRIHRRKQNKKRRFVTVGNVVLEQLRPFRNSMVSHLESFGVSAKKLRLKNLVPLYYNECVSNKHNKSSPFVPINVYEFVDNLSFKIPVSDNVVGDLKDFRNAEGMGKIGNVVENTVNTFKFQMNRRRKAINDGVHPLSVMSELEYRQAIAAERILQRMKQKQQDSYAVKTGTLKNIFVWIFALLILYYLVK
jgi:hypothetical protein